MKRSPFSRKCEPRCALAARLFCRRLAPRSRAPPRSALTVLPTHERADRAVPQSHAGSSSSRSTRTHTSRTAAESSPFVSSCRITRSPYLSTIKPGNSSASLKQSRQASVSVVQHWLRRAIAPAKPSRPAALATPLRRWLPAKPAAEQSARMDCTAPSPAATRDCPPPAADAGAPAQPHRPRQRSAIPHPTRKPKHAPRAADPPHAGLSARQCRAHSSWAWASLAVPRPVSGRAVDLSVGVGNSFEILRSGPFVGPPFVTISVKRRLWLRCRRRLPFFAGPGRFALVMCSLGLIALTGSKLAAGGYCA